MEKDYCARCGSENIKVVNKKLEFNLPNPGIVSVKQKCEECQECGETYLTEKQVKELSGKIDSERKKLD